MCCWKKQRDMFVRMHGMGPALDTQEEKPEKGPEGRTVDIVGGEVISRTEERDLVTKAA